MAPSARRSGTRAAFLAGSLFAAACSHDIDVHPFAIDATDATGAPLEAGLTDVAVVLLEGACTRLSATALSIDTTTHGPVTIQFHNGGDREIIFPEFLDGQVVIAELNISPKHRGLKGPLRIPGLRISIGEHARFLIGEGTFTTVRGDPGLVAPLLPRTELELVQLPIMEVIVDGLAFEPSRCGDLYYDKLRVRGAKSLVLDFGQRANLKVFDPAGLGDWTIHHVASWHRLGTITERGGTITPPKDCKPEGRTWVQAAAWR